jgi:hypothetical protein
MRKTRLNRYSYRELGKLRLAQMELSHKLSPSAQLTVSVGRALTDASDRFQNFQSGATGGIVRAPVAATSDVHTGSYAPAGWRYERNRTSVALSKQRKTDSYFQQSQFDVTGCDTEFSVERTLTRAWSTRPLDSLVNTDYAHVNSTSEDRPIGAAFTLREGRGVEIRLRYDHIARVVSGDGSGYRSNRAFLTIRYRPQ